MTRVRRAAAVLLWLAALGLAGIAGLVWPRLFDSTPDGLGRLALARCEGVAEMPCHVEVLTIGRGRHWIEASAAEANGVVLEFELPSAEAPPRVLLLGASADGLRAAVEHAGEAASWQATATRESGGGQRRRLVRLDDASSVSRLRVTLTREVVPGASEERLRVEEVGLFASEAGLAEDARKVLRGLSDRRLYNGILARTCLWLAGLGVVAALAIPPGRRSWAVPAFVFFLTLAASSVALYVVHNPYWYRARDLRVMLASGPLQDGVGANLNYGMYLGSRLLAGEGLSFGPGWVPWERMPGYGFFCALAGILSGTTDLFAIGLTSIRLHLLFFAAASAAFAAAAARVMRPAVAVAVAALVCFMPNQLANTQADSIMVSIYLLTAGALCLYHERERAGSWPPLRYHLLVHLSFALWFLTRPEAVVGWAALSLILYRRAWRYLLLPAALYLAIGVSWGAYKYRYTGEFSTTTNTVGDNAWIGLWQVPSKFRWQTADASYFEWADRVGVPPTSKRASDTALREVARFAATYPVYVMHLALYRFLEIVDVNVFNGVISYPRVGYEQLRGPAVWSLFAVVTLCFVLPHEPRRALLLGWPLLFNLPLFMLFFSDGMRHIAPCTAALLVTAVPPLLEPAFYRQLVRWRVAAVAAAFVVVWYGAHWAVRALLAADSWRYWTPFLDPAPFAWYLRS